MDDSLVGERTVYRPIAITIAIFSKLMNIFANTV
jgi:hypothetical protein